MLISNQRISQSADTELGAKVWLMTFTILCLSLSQRRASFLLCPSSLFSTAFFLPHYPLTPSFPSPLFFPASVSTLPRLRTQRSPNLSASPRHSSLPSVDPFFHPNGITSEHVSPSLLSTISPLIAGKLMKWSTRMTHPCSLFLYLQCLHPFILKPALSKYLFACVRVVLSPSVCGFAPKILF